MAWKSLNHQNILPLLGATMGDRFVMVSEWMANGNINEFVRADPNADRLGLVRFLFMDLVLACHLKQCNHCSSKTSLRG